MIEGVLDPRSLGIRNYAERLGETLRASGVSYRVNRHPSPQAPAHFHLGNSTRALLPDIARRRRPYAITLHDVIPRARALRGAHRALVLPATVGRASCVIVHSHHAESLLGDTMLASRPRRVEVLPHPATPPKHPSRSVARGALTLGPLPQLGLDGPPLFVLPGTLKRAKLVYETLAAARVFIADGRLRLLLAGAVADAELAEFARYVGAYVLPSPGADDYMRAIVAADVVICARSESVGETNGPLLDAIGAGRPSIVTCVGSAPELAGESATIIAPTIKGLRSGIEAMLDPAARRQHTAATHTQAARFSPERVAGLHAELFADLGWT